MKNFVVDDQVHLPDGFVIGRLGYGRIEWRGAISFSDVDLGDLVRFQRKQVVVYPDETKKPPIGQGFNRPAVITLENIFPYNKETKEEIRVSFTLFKV
jgi:nuclear pore complex protein Nup98-Nup96